MSTKNNASVRNNGRTSTTVSAAAASSGADDSTPMLELNERTIGISRSQDPPLFKGLPSQQRSRALILILIQILLGWLLTVALALSTFAVLSVYDNKDYLSSSTKKEFNAIILGLSVAMGLSVAHGLIDLAGLMRWFVLHRRYWSVYKLEKILEAESILKLFVLAFKTRNLLIQLTASFWLLIVLGAQVGVALLGLCFEVETSKSVANINHPGQVQVTDMSYVQMVDNLKNQQVSSSALEYMVNSYGQMSLAYDTAFIDEMPVKGELRDANDPVMFCDEVNCVYIFYESPVNKTGDNANSLTVATDRSINTTASCQSWPVRNTNSSTGEMTLENNSTQSLTIEFPWPNGTNQTTYLTNTSTTCGEACNIIHAIEVWANTTWYYNCTSTVGTVSGADQPAHEVGETVRRLASEAVALQGFLASSALEDSNLQFQVYPAESVFGFPVGGDASSMASKISRFAIGAIAVLGDNNSPINVAGMVPKQASQLNVKHWNNAIAILVTIPFVHLVLGLVVAWAATRVPIPTGGPIAIAQILRPMGSRDQPIGQRAAKKTPAIGKWSYRWRLVGDGVYDLYMEPQGGFSREKS